MGAEQPYPGRLRFAAQLRYRWDAYGTAGIDRVELHEGQLALSAAWSPSDWLVVSATMPLLVRDVRFENLRRATVVGPGDAELRARVVLLRDRPFAPEHMLGVTTGIELPTSIDQHAPDGTALPYEAQTGSGTFDPLAGLFYAHFADPWALFASATVTTPLSPRFAEAPGPSLSTSLAVQYRVDSTITVRAAVDARWDAPALVNGRRDPTTDQLVVFLSPDLLVSPWTDVTLVFGVRIPTVQLTERGRAEGLYVLTSLVLDTST